MSFDDISSEFNLDDLCPEIDNELQGTFIDILGNDEFELGVFPEEDPDNDSNFIITCEFMEVSGSINSSQVEQIKLKLSDIKKTEEFKYTETFGNENSNGNALYLIVMQWAEQKK